MSENKTCGVDCGCLSIEDCPIFYISKSEREEIWDIFGDHYAFIVRKEPNITLKEVIEYFQKYFTIEYISK